MREPSLEDQLQEVRDAIVTLSDGKWDRNDARAILALVGAFAAFAALIISMLTAAGAFPAAQPEPAPAMAPADTDGGSSGGSTGD